MYKSCVRGAMAGLFLAHALSAAAQSAAIDIKDLRPREIRSTVFRLSAPQELRIMAVGAEADTRRGTFGWVTARWDTNGDRARVPWMGNAWILDLSTRRVVWELSAASTTRGPR